MKEQIYRFTAAVFLTIVALLGLGAVLHVTTTLPPIENAADWVAAIGTVATLIGTIHLATAETRRREKAELVLARLHAAAMINRIELAHNSVFVLVQMLFDRGDVSTIEMHFFQDRLSSLNALDLWQVDDLVSLVPLPNDTAAKLAQAVDQLNRLKLLLKYAQEERSTGAWAELETTRNAIFGRASVVRLQLRDAELECRKTMVPVGANAPE